MNLHKLSLSGADDKSRNQWKCARRRVSSDASPLFHFHGSPPNKKYICTWNSENREKEGGVGWSGGRGETRTKVTKVLKVFFQRLLI